MMNLDLNKKPQLFGCILCLLFWLAVGFFIGRYYYK